MHNITRRHGLFLGLAGAGLATPLGALLASAPVQAQAAFALPDGPVNFIVPVPAGGGTDLTFRALAEASKNYLGRPVVVINLPGAGSAIGLAQAATKPGDGLHVNSYTSELFTLQHFQPTAFSLKDFKPVILVNEDPACLVVSTASKYDTLESFIAAAKAAPGRVTIGNSGFGNIWHLSAAAFAKKAGIDLLQVPYAGAAPTVQAVLGGHVESFVASPPEVGSQVQGGTMRILAVMADQRHPAFPDVPTLKEKGIDLSIGTWRAVGVPASTPDAAVKLLHDAFAQGMQEKSFIEFMNTRGLTIRYMNTQDLAAYVARTRPELEALAAEVAKTKT